MKSHQVDLAFDRINRSISSSRTLLQLETTERLVELFRRQSTFPELNEKLDAIFVAKAESVHYFEWKRYHGHEAEAA